MTGSVNSANFCLMYKLLFVGAGPLNFCKLFINQFIYCILVSLGLFTYRVSIYFLAYRGLFFLRKSQMYSLRYKVCEKIKRLLLILEPGVFPHRKLLRAFF